VVSTFDWFASWHDLVVPDQIFDRIALLVRTSKQMVNSLVIRKDTSVAKRGRALRAAQYVRMSTDYQRYSTQNQAAAIAAFAQQRNLTIVRTYVDEGRSGLTIKGRAGLVKLIDDVRSGQADFENILVYDVSRWGRFQDVDESAHYEFVCKQNGIKVSYCAEQFDNDGSLLSSIVKNIKRVMAAEYSRELSVKVHAGQSRVASLGYRVGGPIGFGLSRELVDETQRSKGTLTKGQRKSLQTDRVRVRLGSEEEAEIIRFIFNQFVMERQSDTEIARRLNQRRVSNPSGSPWTPGKVHTVLKNENYAGNVVYNRTSRRLGQKLVKNPSDQWVRSNAVIDPIVDRTLFVRAQKIMAERRLEIPEEEMLMRLRVLLHRRGELNTSLIDGTLGVSCTASLAKHFGSLRKAYALIGYKSKRDCNWIDTNDAWAAVVTKHATQVADALTSKGRRSLDIVATDTGVKVNGKLRITFVVARQTTRLKPCHAPHWRVYRRKELSGLLAVLRLDDANRNIADYLLLPASAVTGRYLRLSKSVPSNATRLRTLADLIQECRDRLRRGGVHAKRPDRR
jgi:DNA invertase Pin-like site-specific DNA recombinase